MPGRLLIAILALSLPSQVRACAEIPAGASTISITFPMTGTDAKLVSAFGIRFHPLLNQQRMHEGIDWAAERGTPVKASVAGRVESAGVAGQYGNRVVLEHGGGWQTLYAHLSAFDVKEGDCVAQGAVVGRAGATGLTSGPMVHFEVRHAGTAIDPMTLVAP